MTGGGSYRQLAAILAADVVGYSRLMGADEEGTLRRLKDVAATVVEPQVASHRGRIFKTTGDGFLMEFPSVVDAVRCAVAVQTAMGVQSDAEPADRRMQFRISIHVGDVIHESGDVFGDGVNIAARIESVADPGGIALSDRAVDDVRASLDLAVEDMGERHLKNIARPVRVWRVLLASAPARERPALPLPEKPSIAVLPFDNLSGEPAEAYFADGMVEEIITALTRIRWLFVIARNSSFVYRGRAVDIRQVGRELGVRYVLQGSVRRTASRVRIAGQLIDAIGGTNLWADHFDGSPEDVFDLQDRLASSVIGAIAPRLEQAEIERAQRKPTHSLDAYDYYLRGIASAHEVTRESTIEALRLFSSAFERDPNFASAYGMAAWCYVLRKANGWMTERSAEFAAADRLARKAVALGRDDAVALSRGGHALAFVIGDLDAGAAYIDRALELNPNLPAAWLFSGWVRANLGQPEVALDHLQRALRMSPLDPLIFGIENGISFAHFLAGRYDDASAWAEKSLRDSPDYLPSLRFAAASHALAGRQAEAEKAMRRIRVLDPGLSIENLAEVVPIRGPADMARLVEGLRRAGLPEQATN